MSRSLPAALQNEFNADELQPFQALELEFSDGVVRFWTGHGQLNVDDKDWQSIGALLGISPYSESSEIVAEGMSFILGGLDTQVISAILNENYKMRPCALYIGALGSDGLPVSSLFQTFSGRIDTIDIQEDGQTCQIQINAENRLIDLNRPRVRKLTDAEQKLRFPADESLAQVAKLADRQLDWGR